MTNAINYLFISPFLSLPSLDRRTDRPERFDRGAIYDLRVLVLGDKADHLDTVHMNLEETDMYEAIRLAGPRLGYMHVADNTRLAPGTGCLDFKKIFETLKEI